MTVARLVRSLMIVLSSLIAVVYVWKLVELLYLAPQVVEDEVKEVPLSLLAPMWVLIIVTVWFGFDAEFTTQVSDMAANSLFNNGYTKDAVIMGVEGRP